MADWSAKLNDVLAHPLFDSVKPKVQAVTNRDRVVQSFEEINQFFAQHGRAPNQQGDFDEQKLATRLEGIQNDAQKRALCERHDTHALLIKKKAPLSLEEILNSPLINQSSAVASIFDVPKHLIKEQKRDAADFIAQREKCENFYEFEQLFPQVHRDLKEGKRTLLKFSMPHIKEGQFFLVGGMIAYVHKVFDKEKKQFGKKDARTHCIYENGTESYLLLRSLSKAIIQDGQTISARSGTEDELLQENFSTEHYVTGTIYVLKSCSSNPALAPYRHLHKIGFTTRSVEERLAHAEKDSTYLNDKVKLVAEWKVVNIKASQIEADLHRLFDAARLKIQIDDSKGNTYSPDEWFDVPLSLIREAINQLIAGKALSYDHEKQSLELHETQSIMTKLALANKKVLTLNLRKQVFADIESGTQNYITRQLKPTKILRYADYSHENGTYQLISFNVIHFTAKFPEGIKSCFREVTSISFDREKNVVRYDLGEMIK